MLYIFLATIFYTGVLIFASIASRNINSNIVTVVSNSVAGLIPLIIFLPLFTKKAVESGKIGFIAAIVTGICIALFALSINKSLQVNKVAIVSPIVFGGAIFLSAILSYFFFKEKISPFQFAGLAFLGIGLLLIIYSAYTGK